MLRRSNSFSRRRALTLIELLLALGLIVLVCALMFIFYDQIMRSRERGRRVVTEGHLARVVANKIADEIRSASGTLMGAGPGVNGKSRVITMQTTLLPDKETLLPRSIKDRTMPAQCDARTIQYYLAYDDSGSHDYPDGSSGPVPLGLVRTEVKTLFQPEINDLQEVSEHIDLFAPEIKYLRFRYFDGAEWLERWQIGAGMGGMANALPQAVEVTVGYEELPPEKEDELDFDNKNFKPAPSEPYSPKTYTVLVWLPQADAFLGSRLIRAQEMLASNPQTEADAGSAAKGGAKK
jgi:hypothetical protein